MAYSKGKQAHSTGAYTPASMGKKTPSTFSKVTGSAGKSSGTARNGDPKGAPAMGKGK